MLINIESYLTPLYVISQSFHPFGSTIIIQSVTDFYNFNHHSHLFLGPSTFTFFPPLHILTIIANSALHDIYKLEGILAENTLMASCPTHRERQFTCSRLQNSWQPGTPICLTVSAAYCLLTHLNDISLLELLQTSQHYTHVWTHLWSIQQVFVQL